LSFLEDLHNLILRPCFARPFVCDGLPDSCNVIVVGDNPATKVSTDWWSFWDDKTGFNLRQFEESYERARLAAGRQPTSPTRLRLNRLRSQGLRCLETNVFSNERLNGHGSEALSNDLLPIFFERLSGLKAVIAHGRVAERYLQRLNLPSKVRSYYLPHFIRVGYPRIDSVAQEILGIG
jgi:hypothetical protein